MFHYHEKLLTIVLALFAVLAGVLLFPLTSSNVAATSEEGGWKPLFNGKNLDGWYTYLPSVGRNKDPKGVFKVQDGLLHILDIPVTGEDEEFGYIATENEYENYRLRLEYKWGEKKFAPRAEVVRDSGLLYHFVGPDKVWPQMVECQIQEGDTGDIWIVGVTIDTRIVSKELVQYSERGIEHTQTNGRIIKNGTHELPGWNEVEVIVEGDRATHIVNGHVNARMWNIRRADPNDPDRLSPLSRGRIALQAEGAEIFFRNIEIKPL